MSKNGPKEITWSVYILQSKRKSLCLFKRIVNSVYNKNDKKTKSSLRKYQNVPFFSSAGWVCLCLTDSSRCANATFQATRNLDISDLQLEKGPNATWKLKFLLVNL